MKKPTRALFIFISFSMLLVAVFLVFLLEPVPAQERKRTPLTQPVSVVMVTPQSFQPSLRLLGTTKNRWQTVLKARSTAQLEWLKPNLEPGALVKKDELIAKLDTTHLQSQVAQAYSELKQAELNLKKEQHEQTVALKMLSPKSHSAYARKEPQIAAAKAALEHARHTYNSAQKYLTDAEIKAPFDAIILRRYASPKQQVEAGEALFELASSDTLDVDVPIPDIDWSRIESALVEPTITILDRQRNSWPAKVRYHSPKADPQSRQRHVVLSVINPFIPSKTLLANQQVEVLVSLKALPSVAKIPSSALTRDGQVWSIDTQNRLFREEASIIQQSAENTYVEFKSSKQKKRQIVIYPLLSMLPGSKVNPELEQYSVRHSEER